MSLKIPIIISIAVSIGLWFVRGPAVSSLSATLALATLWVSLIPTFVYIRSKDCAPMPFIALTGGYYAVFFAVSVFFFPTPRPLPKYGVQISGLSVEGLTLVLIGVGLMIGSYFFAEKLFSKNLPPLHLPKHYTPKRLRILLWLLILGYLAWHTIPGLKEIPSIGQFIQPTGPLAIAMMIVLWRKGDLPRIDTALCLFVVLPIVLSQAFLSGLLTSAVLLCAFLAVILFYAGFRNFWLYGLIPALFVIAIYPGVAGYRAHTWGEQSKNFNVIERAKVFYEKTQEAWTRKQHFEVTVLEPLIHRLSGHVLLSKVIERTPSTVPYWDGETYKPTLTNLVPRIIWPQKPREVAGQKFAHRYEMIAPENTTTSINVPWIVEMYANFGRMGVIIGMTLTGGFLALLSAFFNRSRMTPLEFVVGAAIVFPLVYPASNFSLMTGTLPQLTLALWLYFRFGLTIGTSKKKAP
jgi:hypothetical protein